MARDIYCSNISSVAWAVMRRLNSGKGATSVHGITYDGKDLLQRWQEGSLTVVHEYDLLLLIIKP